VSPATVTDNRRIYSEEGFSEMLTFERKRSERSSRPFLLMLIEAPDTRQHLSHTVDLSGIMFYVASAIRDTDVIGWYRERTIIGIVFTELTSEDRVHIRRTLLDRLNTILPTEGPDNLLSHFRISTHFFPDDWKEEDAGGGSSDPVLYPDVHSQIKKKEAKLLIKRSMDIVVSSFAILLCLPFLLAISVAIKATSKGPVLFRQPRIGQYGRHFTFLKFRSMRVDNDCSIHREYVSHLIAGTTAAHLNKGKEDGVYKLANDQRVTRIGRLLRRTSMDELPQLINVLRGEMSLVGPRPPIPYELAIYEVWHRQRLLQVKPGITGLWQVKGRSRVSFDEMVRLDLQYANTWSPWVDMKIILQTPAAVFKGAY
jgi:lipopolysaccharide/colanic/teichoic acid biosynthesis glycosyltransferase